MELLDTHAAQHLLVMANGMTQIEFYDLYLKWIFSNIYYKEIMRNTWIFVVLILLPASVYGIYRGYWWALSTDIWVPNKNI